MREDEGEESVCAESHNCPLPWELVNILMLHLTKLFFTLALSEMSRKARETFGFSRPVAERICALS